MRRGLRLILSAVCVAGFCLAAATAASAAPPNDDFANAQVLTGALPLTATGTNVGATRESGEPTPPGTTPAGHSIWFRWEATATEYVSVDTCGSEPRTILAVYTGSALGSLTEVASNRYSDAPDCRSGGSEVTFTAVAGTVYSISVDSDGALSAGEGAIELQLSHPSPPANDDFVDAETVTIGELDFPVSNWGATKEPGEPDHRGNPGGASVWFKWTAPRSGGAFFQACGGPVDDEGLVAVYTGQTVGSLTVVPEIESLAPCDYLFFAQAGVTYRIAFDAAFDAAAGAAEMLETGGSLHYVPHNDDFENASELGSSAAELTIGPTNVGATKQPGEPDHAGNAGGASVWFTWTAPETGSVQFSACEANFPTLIAAYTGSSLTALTPVASDADLSGPARCTLDYHATGQMGFNTEAGTTYDIAVDGYDGAWGDFKLDLWASDERLKAPPVKALPPARPQTEIAGRRIDSAKRTAVFRLRSTVDGSTFRCKLDGRAYSRCGAKVTYGHLATGRHTFRAVAVGPSGLRDPTAAKATFKIARAAVGRRS